MRCGMQSGCEEIAALGRSYKYEIAALGPLLQLLLAVFERVGV